MEPRFEYDAIVVGLGKTGLACVRHFHRRGLRVAAADTRPDPPMAARARREMPELEIRTGALDAGWLSRTGLLVVSPGLSVRERAIEAARQAGVEVIGDIELFARAVHKPVIAITGSNGKSTVTRLVELMGRESGLDVVAAGNIGAPVLDLLEGYEHGAYVMELSSFQLETTYSLRPAAAAVLNVSHDHMDRYPGLDDYIAAKHRIHKGASTIVVNRDDPNTVPSGSAAERWSFGLDQPGGERDFGLVEDSGGTWLARGGDRLLEAGSLQLTGRHNLANVLAALALAAAAGWDVKRCARAAPRFPGLPHRMELVAEIRGVRWVNDSKATNVGATAAALSGAGSPVVLIAGGEGKGADFSPLAPVVARHACAVVLFGRDAPLIEKAIEQATGVSRHRAASLEDAVRQAFDIARAGDTVLLSPACASFDMFTDYEHRGRSFRAAVEKLS